MPSCQVSVETITKILTVLASLVILAASIFTLITMGGFKLESFILAVYYILFALVLIMAQFQVMFILSRFRLMRYKLGKAIYCLMIGLLMIQTVTFGFTMMCAFVLFALGLYHIVMIFFFTNKQKKAEEKLGDISARTAPLQTP